MSIAEKFEVIADAVYEKGKKTQYDKFWDEYQNNGKGRNYAFAFYGPYWNDTTYNPKHDIVVAGSGSSMFANSNITDTLVDIDFSGYSGANTVQVFNSAKKLETIQKLIVAEYNGFSNGFTSCSALKNITFEGVIGKSISFADCPLSIESVKSAIRNLSDKTSGILTLSDTSKGYLTADTEKVEYNGQLYTYYNFAIAKGWDIA